MAGALFRLRRVRDVGVATARRGDADAADTIRQRCKEPRPELARPKQARPKQARLNPPVKAAISAACARLVKWYNGSFVMISWGFDSLSGHHSSTYITDM
jgi:hypothetical protein